MHLRSTGTSTSPYSAKGMIGEMPDTLLMKSGTQGFLIVATFSSMKKESALGAFAKRGRRLGSVQRLQEAKRARSIVS